MLLAQQAGGWVFYPGPQAVLSGLLTVWTASQGPTQPHLGSLHCRSHPGHPPHDSPGGVEEQTQWGNCVVKGRRVAWSEDSRQEVHFGPKVKLHFPSVTKGALSMCACGFSKVSVTLLGLEVYHDKITTTCSLSDAWVHIYMKPSQLPFVIIPTVYCGLK